MTSTFRCTTMHSPPQTGVVVAVVDTPFASHSLHNWHGYPSRCLDHVIVLNATGLRTILKSYLAYLSSSTPRFPTCGGTNSLHKEVVLR
jgi:hypothetical protein